MILYLAGPMRGYPGWNFAAFDDGAKALCDVGYAVASPVDTDRDLGITEQSTDAEVKAVLPLVLSVDIEAIRHSDGIALLPGWPASEGVAFELHYARLIGRDALTVQEWIDRAN